MASRYKDSPPMMKTLSTESLRFAARRAFSTSPSDFTTMTEGGIASLDRMSSSRERTMLSRLGRGR